MKNVTCLEAGKRYSAWAGFSDGHICPLKIDDGFGGYAGKPNRIAPALFLTKKDALAQFQDVRKVTITVDSE